MTYKQKGFFSIVTLLFVLMFILGTSNQKENILDIGIITLAETKQASKMIAFEQIVENNLDNDIENPSRLKKKVNDDLYGFFEDKDLYVYNLITKEKQKMTLTNLDHITHVIVYKPARNVVIKRYKITNGANKDQSLVFFIDSINYQATYFFPKDYMKEVVVYKK